MKSQLGREIWVNSLLKIDFSQKLPIYDNFRIFFPIEVFFG